MSASIAAVLAGAFEIVRLVVEPVRLDAGWTTSIRCRLRPQKGGSLVEVVFKGVTDLVVRQTSSNFAVTPQIISIEDRGWDQARFEFTDPGNASLEFRFVEAELEPEP